MKLEGFAGFGVVKKRRVMEVRLRVRKLYVALNLASRPSGIWWSWWFGSLTNLSGHLRISVQNSNFVGLLRPACSLTVQLPLPLRLA